MQVQRDGRISKRMPCAVHVGERRYSGLVLNVSQGGLFIQSNADPGRGSEVSLELQAPDESFGIPLSGTVAWRKVVPNQLRTMQGGGFGLRIEQADERYYRAVARWMRIEPVEPGTPNRRPRRSLFEDSGMPSWRVRVRAADSPRSRSLTVEAPDAEQARKEALEHVGHGWNVIEVESL